MSYEFPAWCQMETALEQYQQAREEHLTAEVEKLGPHGKRRLQEFNQLADMLVKGVQDLAGIDGLQSLATLLMSVEFPGSKTFELLKEHVCITLGREVMSLLDTASDRFFSLLTLLRDRKPCDNAAAFLQRVARCYLFGFDAECITMCRATLDQEFGDTVIDDDQVSEWWKWYATTPDGQKYRGKRPPYGKLWAKILAAEHAGLIKEPDRKAADAVRDSGNEGIHKKPSCDDALKKIEQTVQVLDALEAARHPQGK